MEKVSKIYDFDEVFDKSLTPKKVKNSNTLSKKQTRNTTVFKKVYFPDTKQSNPIMIKSVIDSLTDHANSNIFYQITNSPEYIELVKKINECELNIKKFSRVNDYEEIDYWKRELEIAKESFFVYKEMLSVHDVRLSVKSSKLFRNSKSSPRTSKEIQDAQYKLDCVKAEMRRNSPSYIVSQLKEIREQLNLRDLYSNDNVVRDLDDVFESQKAGFTNIYLEEDLENNISPIIEDLDDINFNECPDRILLNKYNNICTEIAKRIDCTPDEVSEMKLGTILSMLKSKTPNKDSELVEKYNKAQIELMNARSDISKKTINYGICEYINDKYDIFDEDDEKKVKELLASLYIRVVKGIAYNIVSRRNQLNLYEEAVSYGLVGLSMAINKWLIQQKNEPNIVIEFKGLCNSFVAGSIKSGLAELLSLGTASASHIQHQTIDINKRVNNFLKYNPEYKNVDREEIIKMLSDNDHYFGRVNFVYESTYNEISENSSKSNSENTELWDIVTSSKENLESYTESKNDYQLLIRSIKQMLNLFETDKDCVNGQTYKNGRKLFDRYETRLFEMTFGFSWKKNSRNTGNSQFTQSEMGEELRKMYAEQGIDKTFSQPAITSRINTLKKKIQFAVENNKKLKRAFEYINKRWEENPEYMNMISNEHEENMESFCPPPSKIFKSIEEQHENLKKDFYEISISDKSLEDKILSITKPKEING